MLYVKLLTKLTPEECVTILCQLVTSSSIIRWHSKVKILYLLLILTRRISRTTCKKQQYTKQQNVYDRWEVSNFTVGEEFKYNEDSNIYETVVWDIQIWIKLFLFTSSRYVFRAVYYFSVCCRVTQKTDLKRSRTHSVSWRLTSP